MVKRRKIGERKQMLWALQSHLFIFLLETTRTHCLCSILSGERKKHGVVVAKDILYTTKYKPRVAKKKNLGLNRKPREVNPTPVLIKP